MRTKGFTLIELVVVIVILGILAVTAAPRFLNVSSDAKKASLNGFIGAFNATDGIVISKAMPSGMENIQKAGNIPNTNLYVLAGHMSLVDNHISEAMQIEGNIKYVNNPAEANNHSRVYIGENPDVDWMDASLSAMLK